MKIVLTSILLFMALSSSALESAAPESSQPAVGEVMIDADAPGEAIHSSVLGINDFIAAPESPRSSVLASAGMTAMRYPGGSDSDMFDWQTGETCKVAHIKRSTLYPFQQFVETTVLPLKLSLEITVNYGSSNQPLCDAPGSPNQAAAWVHYANVVHGYGIKWWEIGNEVWGPWEMDAHRPAHDAATFSEATRQYFSLMKAEDPSIMIGVPLVGYKLLDAAGNDWDQYVLSHAAYDYVTLHSYNGIGSKQADADLLQAGPAKLLRLIMYTKAALAKVGKSNTPISLSEWNSAYASPGKQSVSIVNGLYAGEMLSTMLRLGISRAEFWNAYGCEYPVKDFSSIGIYGWQHFGSLGAFSEGIPFPTTASGCYFDTLDRVPRDTLFPPARAFQILAKSGFVRDSEHMLTVSAPTSDARLRIYAATHKNGWALFALNLDADHTISVPVVITRHLVPITSRLKLTFFRYGKQQYDLTSNNGRWVDIITGGAAFADGHVKLDLPPWSMTAYIITST